MPQEPNIHIIQDNLEETLEAFTVQARLSDSPVWRCFYATTPSNFEIEDSNKNIILEFLRESLSDADDVEVFWLISGHLFVFFQGHISSVTQGYERFLVQINDQKEKTEYHFFWELDHFWGYFDEVLENVLGKKVDEVMQPHVSREKRHKPLLLIMDDDRTTRRLIKSMMQEHCDIVIAWNAEQAEKIYKSMLPNMAFLDIQVPYGDGEELAVELCMHDTDAFIVMVSGALKHGQVERCVQAGVRGCVSKPTDQATLLSYLNQYNQERQPQTASA